MTKLSSSARTILRNRVRKHPKAATVTGGESVSNMSAADLIQGALSLGVALPTPAECAAYEAAKANGAKPAAALRAAAAVNGTPAPDMDDAAADLDAEHADADDADADDDGDDAPAPADKPEGEGKPDPDKAARARVLEVQEPLGRGDFATFADRLMALARDAEKPAPAPVVQYVPDPAKIKGTVPAVVGRRTMKGAGLVAGNLIAVDDACTALDLYNAPDAPRLDPDYVWPPATGAVLAALSLGGNAFLYGPAGTGKTTFAQQLAARWGRPFVRISCDDQTEAATLVGMTVPDSASGGVKWQDGQLAAAIRRPGTVVLVDEPSVARPGALFVLQAVLDGDRALHVAETGETIPCAPGVLVLLADNTNGTGDESGQYEATRRLNRAFLDRADVTLRLGYLAPAEEADALAKRTGCTKTLAASLVKFANLTRRKADDDGALSHGLGFRRLTALARQVRAGVPPALAFQLTVVETAPFDDRETLRQLWEAEIGNRKLS